VHGTPEVKDAIEREVLGQVGRRVDSKVRATVILEGVMPGGFSNMLDNMDIYAKTSGSSPTAAVDEAKKIVEVTDTTIQDDDSDNKKIIEIV